MQERPAKASIPEDSPNISSPQSPTAPAGVTRYVASPNRGLVGYWKLDEGSGTTAADASGNGYTGTLTGSPTWSAVKPPTLHYPDPYALTFDGADRYVNVPHDASLSPAAFTVAAWIKASAWTTAIHQGTIVAKDSATGYSGYVLRSGENGRLSFAVGNGAAWSEATSPQVMVANTWHHVAGVFDGSVLKVYIDGVEQGSASSGGPLVASSNPLNIGRSPAYTDRRFQGMLDDVRLYSRALTQPELMALSGGNLAASLLLNWKFDEGSGATAADTSGNSRDGTLDAGSPPTWAPGKPAAVTYYDPYGLDFNGAGNHVYRYDDGLNLNASSLTLAAWIKADTWQTNRHEGTLISKESTSDEYGYVLRTGDNGRLSFAIGDGAGWPEAYSTQVMAAGTWYHVAGTLDDSTHTLRIYINGIERGSATASDGLYASGNNFRVAASEWPGRYFDGRIDDVRVYNRVLTTAEIAALAGSANDCTSAATPCISLQSAIETAAAGDTLVAQPGLYLERIFIAKSLTLRNSGTGTDLLLDGFSAGPVVTALSGGVATLQYLTLQHGGTASSYGGGAAVLAGGQLTLEQAVVTANTAQYGAGVYSAGALAIRDSLITGNSATHGGGVGVNDGATTIRNSTIISNTASGNGGGIATLSSSSALKVSFSTITGNRAATAGGIYQGWGGSVALKGTLIAYNTLTGGGTAGAEDCAGTLTSAGYNLVRTAAFGSGVCAIATAQTGDAVGGEYPLGALKDNGGLTRTVAPLPGNIAIDRVPADSCTDLDGAAVSADQRGISRPQDSAGSGTAACEVGAFERRPTPLLTVTTIADEFGELDDICGLREAIQSVNTQATFGGCGYTAGAYTVTLPAGSYGLTRAGAGEDANATGDLDILRRLILQGAGAATTIIQANGLDRVLHAQSVSGDPVEINGVTLTGGSVTGPGGGVYVQTGDLTLRAAGVYGNVASTNGGGLAAGGALTVITTTVRNNTAANGGGLAGLAGSSLTVADSAVSDNAATTAGGGFYMAGALLVKNSTVYGNTANAGGGISAAAGGQADLRFVTLAENRTLLNTGAHLQNGGALTLTATIVTLPVGGASCAGVALGTGGYNRLSDGSCSFTTVPGTDATNATIDLLPASLNGGATLTYLPRATGTNALLDIVPQAPCEQALGGLTDQRGQPRPRAIIGSNSCDAGAVELSRQVRTVCGPPLSRASTDPRCNFLGIGLALAEARDGDTIVVAGVVTETVTVSQSVTIRGPLPAESTPGTHLGVVQAATTPGGAAGPIFTIPAGQQVTLQGLNIRYAAVTAGGVISNAGRLTLDGVTLYANNVSGTGSVIHNSGDLAVINSTVSDNTGSYAPPTSGLVGHWQFDEGSGTAAADGSGNGNTGTLTSGPTWTSATPTLGWSNPYALAFDGSNDYVSVADQATLRPVTLTVAAWIRADAWKTESYQGVVVGKDDDSAPAGHGYTLRTGAGGVLSFAIVSTGGECHALSDALMSTGTWTHVAGVYDGSTVKVFINGVERASAACATAITHSTNPLVIGRSARYTDRLFQGTIDDVRLYSRALSAGELSGLANSASSAGDMVVLRNTANVAGAVTIQSATLVGAGVMVRNEAALAQAVVITNTILSAAAGAECLNVTSGGNNLTHNVACFATPGTGDRSGAPGLGSLRDNGGPTLTRAIAAGSPARGATPCPVTADQRGRARSAAFCASGAVDFAAQTLMVCANCQDDAALGRYADLQGALNAAMAGDTVRIEAGAYTGNFIAYRDVTLEHAGIDVSTLSRERPTDVRAILQASAQTVAGQRQLGSPAGTALTVQSYAPTATTIAASSDVSVTLRGLTLRYGLSTTGGGIANLGTLAVYTSTVAENAAYNVMSGGTVVTPGRGGGIYNAGRLTLERSTVSGNQAESAGGGIYNAGPAGAGAAATVSVSASTLADNRASRLPEQKLVGVTDSGMAPISLTITSGDEIRFENRTARSRTLNVAAGAGVTCQPQQVAVPPMGAGLSAALVCSGGGSAAVTDADNASLTLAVTVQAVSFTPAGHALYRAGNSTTTVGRSLVFQTFEVSETSKVCGRPGADTFAIMISAGYNLVSDESCFPEPKPTDLQVGQEEVGRLGPLQDNNAIDFEGSWVSGYTYTHAPKPGSRALDFIPQSVCAAAGEQNIAVTAGALPTTTLSAGDTVIWRQVYTAARTIVLNDGEATAELIALPAAGATTPRQFTAAGSYLYRVYDDATRTEVAAGTLTVLAKARPTDQRGVALPQRGTLAGSYACDVGAVEFQPWVVGQPLPRPPAAVGIAAPAWLVNGSSVESQDPPYHVWSPATALDYALRPSRPDQTVTAVWNCSMDPAARLEISQVGVVEWPANPQLHVSGAPVNLSHTGITDGFLVADVRAFEGTGPADDLAGTILNQGVFTRTVRSSASYSVLQFAKGNQANVTLRVAVVRTVDWNSPGVRDMTLQRSACTIGSELHYPLHSDPEGKNGRILDGNAYDGIRSQVALETVQNTVDGLIPPAYSQDTRQGPIIPLLNIAPTVFANRDPVTGGHDLRIAWYRPDGRQVAWPVKTVGYRCDWPANPPQIVIASELGSEIDGQAQLSSDRYADLTVYHQPSQEQPGYSPNHEHALLAASNLGNAASALYALRTDLQDRNPTATGSQSYALLKYHDPRDANQTKIAIYQVVLTRTAPAITDYTAVAGRITVAATDLRGLADLEGLQSTATIRVRDANAAAGAAVQTTLEALNVSNLRTATIRVAYDPAKLTPTACAPNQADFAERLTALQVTSDAPRRPGTVAHFRAAVAAGTGALFTWDFGDGITQSTGSQVSHAYGTARVYTVTVTARSGAFSDALTASIPVTISAEAPLGALASLTATGCRIGPAGTLTFDLAAQEKHGASGSLVLADLTFTSTLAAGQSATLTPTVVNVLGPSYDRLAYDVVAGNPVYAPTPLRGLLDIQACSQTRAADVTARPFWKDFRNALWARAAGDMDVLYFYPLQAGFYLSDADAIALGLTDSSGVALPPAERVGLCVPWLHKLAAGVIYPDFPQAGQNTRVLPVAYHAEWPALPPLLSVGETVYERTKNGISGVASQLAVARVYDDLAPGAWISNTIVVTGSQAMRSVAQLINPTAEARVAMNVKINGNFSLPEEIQTEQRLATLGGGLSIVGNKTNLNLALPFALRSRVSFAQATGELIFGGYYDGASPEYIKGEPLLLLNVMATSDRARLQALCLSGGTAYPFDATNCGKYKKAVADLYYRTRNPRGLDLCRDSSGKLAADDGEPATNQLAKTSGMTVCRTEGATAYYRDGRADWAFMIGVQDANNDGIAEPYAGVGKGQALTAGAAAGTGFITLAYNNDASLGGLPVSLQVIKVGCELNTAGDDSTYRGNLLTIKSDNLFDEKLTLRHTGDFGGRPDDFTYEWWIAAVDETAVSPSAVPPAYPWSRWTKLELGASALGPEITIEGANPTTLRDNWLIARYKGYAACGNQVVWSAFAGDPSAKPSEVRAQLAEGWIKRVTSALNPFDARVDDFVSSPVNTTVDMISQAGKRYEGPIAMNNDPENLNRIGLIEAYQTVLDRGRQLSIDSGINDQGANAALLNVTSRIADLYMLLGNDAYADALDPSIGLSTSSSLGTRAPAIYAFMNQFRSDSFGLIDEELGLLRGRDQTLGGVAAAPTYNRLTWNFTHGDGAVAYQQNYNIKDVNGDGFINEADAALMYPQGHGDTWGQYLTAITKYYELLRHPNYTWVPRAEPVNVAGAPVVVDYYDERRFAIDAANKARVGAEIADLAYRKNYAEPTSQSYEDTYVDTTDTCAQQSPADCQERAWGVADWARRAGQGAYFDWVTVNAILPPVDDRYSDVRKIDRTTVSEIGEIASQYAAIQRTLDNADNGLNPLGLASNAVLFDLDPALTKTTPGKEGLTHFEQVYARAIASLNSAATTFDYAAEMKVAQRQSQDALYDFEAGIVDQDRSLVNQLIDIFGYPYNADIGVNGTYPAGYDGPDIYNYDLWERTELTDAQKRCSDTDRQNQHCSAETKTYTVQWAPIDCLGNFVKKVVGDATAPLPSIGDLRDNLCKGAGVDDNGKLAPPGSEAITITYRIGSGLDAGYGRFKPDTWPTSSSRAALGEVQNKLQTLYQAKNEYESAVQKYQNQASAIEGQYGRIRDRADVLYRKGVETVNLKATISVLDTTVVTLKAIARFARVAQNAATDAIKGAAECPPKDVGLANDVTSAIRCGIRLSGLALVKPALIQEQVADTGTDIAGLAKSVADAAVQIDLFVRDSDWELRQMGRDMGGLLRTEKELRLAMYLAKDKYLAAQDSYDTTVQKGFRKLQELILFRKRWAGQISEQRYGDMALRIFQNDALAKYRQEFDIAQLYTYETAVAYDYETNLAGNDSANGDQFVRQIVGLRSLGEIRAGLPIAGSHGLADPLARMSEDFAVLKGQMGFNNPQAQTHRFSLRHELFRLKDSSDAKWQQTLQQYYTSDIFSNDAVARLAKRPYGTTGPQPGLVIPFGTTIKQGLNLFGLPLGPDDGAYNATQFVTKIANVGVWFQDYDTARLASMPYVYLLPAGKDVIRPRSANGELRYWNVTEQLLPMPYPLGVTQLQDPNWIARINGLDGQLFATKPYAAFQAFPFSAALTPGELNTDTRLIGRSVWNTEWVLVIPGATLLADPEVGIERFMQDVDDIYLYFQTYAYAGTAAAAKAQAKVEAKAKTASTSTSTSSSPLPLPDVLFYGTVARNNEPLTSGTVKAILPRGAVVSVAVTPIQGTNYTYAFAVHLSQYSPDLGAYAADSARPGETIRFLVNDAPATFRDANGATTDQFVIPTNGSGQPYRLDPALVGPDSYPLGDVNANGVRNSADALLILKYDVGLIAGDTNFPPGPGKIYLPLCDIVQDGRCNSGDALRVLQCDAQMPGVSCPSRPTAAATQTFEVSETSKVSPTASLVFRPELLRGPAANQVTVRVRAIDPTRSLGAAALQLHYDATRLTVATCTADPARVLDGAVCNPAYRPDAVWLNGIAAKGAAGAVLADITFRLLQPAEIGTLNELRDAFLLTADGAFDVAGRDLPWRSTPAAEPTTPDDAPRRFYLPLIVRPAGNLQRTAADRQIAPQQLERRMYLPLMGR